MTPAADDELLQARLPRHQQGRGHLARLARENAEGDLAADPDCRDDSGGVPGPPTSIT